jgi:hypothetical protein
MFKLTKFLLPTLILSSFLIGYQQEVNGIDLKHQQEAKRNDVKQQQEVKRSDENNKVVFTFKIIKKDKGNLSIKYPVFEGEAFKDINDFIDKEVKDVMNNYYDAKKDAKETVKESGFKFEPLYHLNIATYIIDKDIINLKEFLFIYEGGAHGMPGEIWKVFIKDENQKKYVQIKLSDIINLNGKCEKNLRQAIYKDLKNQNASSSENIFQQDLTLDNFYLDQKTIVFVFNPYEVGSFAEGIYRVEISYDFPCIKKDSIIKKFLD